MSFSNLPELVIDTLFLNHVFRRAKEESRENKVYLDRKVIRCENLLIFLCFWSRRRRPPSISKDDGCTLLGHFRVLHCL